MAKTNISIVDTAIKLESTIGQAPAYAARAWVKFNGTTATIGRSQNVSNVVRNSTGNYTINFSTPMQDTNYSIIGTALIANNPAGIILMVVSRTINSCVVTTYNSSFSPGDCTDISIAILS